MSRKPSATRGKPRSAVATEGQQTFSAGHWMGFASLVMLVTVSAIAVVYTTHSNRALLNELHQLEQQRNELGVEWSQLNLEHSSLSQGLVEAEAVNTLGMKAPALERVIIVTDSRN